MNAQDIKKLRLRLHLSQEKFAYKLGVSVPTVSRWERGVSIPSQLGERRLNRLNKSKG